MAVTFNTHTGDGTTGPFPFTFEYIDETDVKVSIDGVTQATTEYTFPTASTIQFTTQTPDATKTIRIFRDTNIDDLKATFFAGSAIRAQDLNNNFEQNNFAVQEIETQYVTKSNGEFDTDVDMNSNKITELADPTAAQDAATKNYVDTQTWSDTDETIDSGESWASNDARIATTGAIDGRIDAKIDTAITTDIGTDNTGITVTDDGDGTITLGLANIDLDRIKGVDKIILSEQDASASSTNSGNTANVDDDSLFTTAAAAKRFDTIVQTGTPAGTDYEVGKTWLDIDNDLTLSIWNGTAWNSITSGGTFTNQPKVIYVDATAGSDDNDGHRISRPKQTIQNALADINADASGDGTVIILAPGIYTETLPLDIQKNDIGIIGQSLRTCIIHPKIPTADQAGYDVNTPHSQELQTMFRVNSGTYISNVTLTGLKASGGRGTGASLYTDATHGLPPNQGWNFAFFPNAVIKKSPYIQNVTNFSDSQINNVTFTPHTPGEGAAGDLDSAPTGGGILIDGSTPDSTSPLRSMVCDSYTHTALDGPGIFVTNNGYCQATSSYAFFNHAHIICLNGGQANLAASTTDFGRFGLIADGKSTTAIFTSNVDGAANSGDLTFNINEPTAGANWFGDTQRPATNMLVEVNSVIYPILSATANTDSEGGAGWTVTISRPDSNDRSNNLGLNGAVADDLAVSFYLRSMIASSGHTMEYVGSGTDYRALPENGGVPDENDQKIELNNGKIWAATTDHNGKFTIGGNQTDDPIFEVDQQLGFVTIPEGSISFNLLSDETPQLGGNLDVNGNEIVSTSNGNIVINPDGTGVVQLGGNLDVNGNEITSNSNGDIVINPNGTGDIELGAPVGIGVNDPGSADLAIVHARDASNYARFSIGQDTDGSGVDHLGIWYGNNNTAQADIFTSDGDLNFWVDGSLGVSSTSTFSWGERFTTDWMELSTQALRIPTGTTADRPDGTAGQIRYNTTNSQFEGFGTAWGGFGGASGAGGNAVFYENDQTVTTSYEITENKNAMSAGPITIDSGAVVTVPSGSTWVIV